MPEQVVLQSVNCGSINDCGEEKCHKHSQMCVEVVQSTGEQLLSELRDAESETEFILQGA